MKYSALILGILFTLASCSSPVVRNVASDSKSCRDYTESASSFLTYTKTMNPKNVLYFGVRYDAQCKVVGEVFPYWVMGEESGQCAGLTSKEQGYFSPKNAVFGDKNASFSIGVIDLINSKQSTLKVANKVMVNLAQTDKGCVATNTVAITQNGVTENIQISNLHAEVKLLSIDKIIIKGKRSNGTAYNNTISVK